MLLTEHAILKGKGTGRHPRDRTDQLNQPGYQWSTVFLLGLLCNTCSTHLAMNH